MKINGRNLFLKVILLLAIGIFLPQPHACELSAEDTCEKDIRVLSDAKAEGGACFFLETINYNMEEENYLVFCKIQNVLLIKIFREMLKPFS